MKTLIVMVVDTVPLVVGTVSLVIGTASLLVTDVALAQDMTMMNGHSPGTGWMDGYGGPALPILLVIAAIALFVRVVRRDEN